MTPQNILSKVRCQIQYQYQNKLEMSISRGYDSVIRRMNIGVFRHRLHVCIFYFRFEIGRQVMKGKMERYDLVLLYFICLQTTVIMRM